MAALPDGEYLVTSVQWHKTDQEEAFRSLHGFTTGKLVVSGSNAELTARFNDQFLSNRLSDLEEDEVPVNLQVEVLERDDAVHLSGSAPTVDRSGASYMLKVEGTFSHVGSGAVAEKG